MTRSSSGRSKAPAEVEGDWDEVGDIVTDAYRVIAPRRLRGQLGTR